MVLRPPTTRAQCCTNEDEVRPFFVNVGLLAPPSLNEQEGQEWEEKEERVVKIDPYAMRLLRTSHIKYLISEWHCPIGALLGWTPASHPWMVYWCLHSLDILGYFDVAVEVDDDGNEGLILKSGTKRKCC